jgi:hypothetical protein
MVPSTAVMPRDGSLALAFFGRVRKVQESDFLLCAGRKSFALKRILEAVLVTLLGITDQVLGKQRLIHPARLNRVRRGTEDHRSRDLTAKCRIHKSPSTLRRTRVLMKNARL